MVIYFFTMSSQAHVDRSSEDLPSKETAYGKVFTWDENRSKPQSNLAEFLKKLASDVELQERIKNVQSQQEVIDIAAEFGIDFTVETLEARARTLPHVGEDTLEEVRWARWGQSEEGRRWAMNVWVKL